MLRLGFLDDGAAAVQLAVAGAPVENLHGHACCGGGGLRSAAAANTSRRVGINW